VGVAGEHEIDERATGMSYDCVGVVGLVGHENNRAIRIGGKSEIQVWNAGAWVIDAA